MTPLPGDVRDAARPSRYRLSLVLTRAQGGTSSDVSRYDGSYETVFETTTAGVTVQSPQLDISASNVPAGLTSADTVAAGGGSRLFFRNGLFAVGPESAGASPGPSCYRFASARRDDTDTSSKGGPVAITDANLVLGRLVVEHFPKVRACDLLILTRPDLRQV